MTLCVDIYGLLYRQAPSSAAVKELHGAITKVKREPKFENSCSGRDRPAGRRHRSRLETTLIIRLHFAQNSESSYGRVELMSASMLGIPFDYGRSYQYPREVWRPTRVEIRCAVGPGAALPARTSDPAEDLRPRPRRHIVPAREQNTRKIVVITRIRDFACRSRRRFARAK